jgi:IS30 family transposase
MDIQEKLNSWPRNCLDYFTRNDIFKLPLPLALAA